MGAIEENVSSPQQDLLVTVDVLIVGAGPSGASLASFLGYYGIKGLLISRDVSTAPQPRAHFTNPAAWECLRDIGLEEEYRKAGMSKDYYGDYRFCNTLAGEDIMRMHSFSRTPDRLGDYEEASPCKHGDVSQNVGEPILIKYATQHGFQSRFNCKFLRYEADPVTGIITSTIQDQTTGGMFRVASKYLCGADGAGSYIARQLELPFHVITGGGNALNVWYEADLSHLYQRNPGMLHGVSTPYIEPPPWSVRGVSRVVRPYSEFVMAMQSERGYVPTGPLSDEEVMTRLRQMIGDDSVEIKLKGVYYWKINETYAEVISKGNIFCLGDAIHRHPPGNGLGSNTSIQDAYNLAWKLAHVLQGKAGPSILTSYECERQPIAKRIVRVANDAYRLHGALYSAMGILEPSVAERAAAIKELSEATTKGSTRRAALAKAREDVLDEVTGLGAEMNQMYISNAVVSNDESSMERPHWSDGIGSAGVRQHIISTYPGSRLPHAWLGTAKYGGKLSTHDITGKGQFTLLTGIGGKAVWSNAARDIATALGNGVEIVVRSIGHGQEFIDLYDTWSKRRDVQESGAILIRPDRVVAWRAARAETGSADQLLKVMRQILSISDD